MTTKETLKQLDDLIASRSILNHPFYQAWTAGTLTRADLQTYAASYYPHVAAFPGYLETAAAGAQDAAKQIRSEVAHIEFADGMGADRSTITAAPTTEATQATVSEFQSLCQESTLAGVVALYAYESQQPEVAKRKAAGLCERYGVTDSKTLEYFTVHAEADLRHREGERRAIETLLENGASADETLKAANRALDAYWGLLDGVCVEAGIEMVC